MTPRKLILVAVACLAAAMGAGAGLAGNGTKQGVFKTHCLVSHVKADDPLMLPGQPGASHLHVFMGNTSTDAYSTGDSLEAANSPLGAGTTCVEDGDGSAYWVPALYDETSPGVYREYDPRNLGIYYTDDRDPAVEKASPFATGFGEIAGNGPGRVGSAVWACGLGGTKDGRSDTAPAQCADGEMTAIVMFAACWDGKTLFADDNSHVVYGKGSDACPPDHPVLIPRLQGHIFYKVGTGTHNWVLAYDPDMGGYMPTSMMHMDFLNGWDPSTLAARVDNCLNTRPDDPNLCIGNT